MDRKGAGVTRPDENHDGDLVPDERMDPEVRDIEAPPEDAAEQSIPVGPAFTRPETPEEIHPGLEVGEWDAVEQSTVVDLDEDDDYR